MCQENTLLVNTNQQRWTGYRGRRWHASSPRRIKRD